MSAYETLKTQLKSTPRTWLITGVAGFIGSNLLETLLNLNQRVVGLDNTSKAGNSRLITDNSKLPTPGAAGYGHQKNIDEALNPKPRTSNPEPRTPNPEPRTPNLEPRTPNPQIIMGNFKELKTWQRAKDLAVFIYKVTNDGIFSKDFGLRDQIRRAAVSIPSNLAEGDELGTNKQAVNFFYTAKGSTAEVQTQAIIAKEIGYIEEEVYKQINGECEAISRMLTRLIEARKK